MKRSLVLRTPAPVTISWRPAVRLSCALFSKVESEFADVGDVALVPVIDALKDEGGVRAEHVRPAGVEAVRVETVAIEQIVGRMEEVALQHYGVGFAAEVDPEARLPAAEIVVGVGADRPGQPLAVEPVRGDAHRSRRAERESVARRRRALIRADGPANEPADRVLGAFGRDGDDAVHRVRAVRAFRRGR